MRLHRPRGLGTRPSVSVVIPCYNYGHFLPDAARSVLEQPGVDVEVVVVDDCSTDDSAAVARALSAADARVRVITHATNAGHIGTYNDGLAAATGDYIALLSADDRLSPGALGRAVALMEHHPDVGFTYGPVVEFSDVPPATMDARRTTWSTWTGEEWLGHVCRSGRNLVVSPEVLMRRELAEELGGYDRAHPHAADLLMWMRAAARGGVGRVNGPAQAYYRIHAHNMHSTQFAGLVTDYSAVAAVFDDFFAESGDLLTRPQTLATQARRAMALEALERAAVLGPEAPETAVALVAMARRLAPDVSLPVHRSGSARDVLRRRVHALRWSWRSRRWRWVGV